MGDSNTGGDNKLDAEEEDSDCRAITWRWKSAAFDVCLSRDFSVSRTVICVGGGSC